MFRDTISGEFTMDFKRRESERETPPPLPVPTPLLKRGNLLFFVWGNKVWDGRERIQHTEIVYTPWQSFGASGGGSSTTTVEKAIQHNAFCKVRPIRVDNVVGIVKVEDVLRDTIAGQVR
jgi:hypothetical protein